LLARAEALLDSTLVIDMHSHAAGISRKSGPLDVAAMMRSGHLSAICLALVSDSPVLAHTDSKIFATRQPRSGELYTHMLNHLQMADRMMADYKIARVLTLADLRAAKAQNRTAIIFATEGSDYHEGRLDRVHYIYERGVRHLQLMHYRAQNDIGDIQTEAPLNNGATAFGLDVVRACNRLGIVVDVAHATLPTVKKIAEISTEPLILSHTSFTAAPKTYSRQIGAEHAQLVAATGGVVGVWVNGHTFHDYAAFAEGVTRLADIVGIDHVGIGTDLNGLLRSMLPSYREFPELVAHLFKHFSDDDIRKIVGGNYLRVFDRVTNNVESGRSS